MNQNTAANSDHCPSCGGRLYAIPRLTYDPPCICSRGDVFQPIEGSAFFWIARAGDFEARLNDTVTLNGQLIEKIEQLEADKAKLRAAAEAADRGRIALNVELVERLERERDEARAWARHFRWWSWQIAQIAKIWSQKWYADFDKRKRGLK